MVSFSKSKTPDQARREAEMERDKYKRETQRLQKQISQLKADMEQLKNANQEVAYWKDVAESLQEYIDIMEE